MGDKEIERKVNDLILDPKFQCTKQDVVYILVELYKFCEQRNWLNSYKYLRFFRDWVAHTRKDRPTSVQRTEVVKEVNGQECLDTSKLLENIRDLINDDAGDVLEAKWIQFEQELISNIQDQDWQIVSVTDKIRIEKRLGMGVVVNVD